LLSLIVTFQRPQDRIFWACWCTAYRRRKREAES
jgi:hypothetical protein